jgi:hypothetical protein
VELSHNPSVEPVATAANAGRCEIAGVADHLTPLNEGVFACSLNLALAAD